MRTVAIIQARMGSTRLPGKVMKDLCGKTVLAHVVRRVRACSLIDDVVVATTSSPADDVIVSEAQKCGASWFRGSEDDVLDRYWRAARQFGAQVVVRVTSDCPLLDPEILRRMLEHFRKETSRGRRIDYLSNTLEPRTYPRGLDAEAFTFDALERAWREAGEPWEREHVTPYIYGHPEFFALDAWRNDEDLSGYRLTLDTEEDWELISRIYGALYRDEEVFGLRETTALLRQKPDLARINAHVVQKELGE
jgi:spore coat polysaccharide biosynthesis protein SpsF